VQWQCKQVAGGGRRVCRHRVNRQAAGTADCSGVTRVGGGVAPVQVGNAGRWQWHWNGSRWQQWPCGR